MARIKKHNKGIGNDNIYVVASIASIIMFALSIAFTILTPLAMVFESAKDCEVWILGIPACLATFLISLVCCFVFYYLINYLIEK